MVRFVTFLLFFMFVELQAFTLSGKVTIVIKQKSNAFIYSAKELSNYIEKITDKKPTVSFTVPKNNSSVILLKLQNNKLKSDGFVVKTKGKNLVIASSSDRGIIYGCYYFLENYLGCRFLSQDFEYIPKYKKKSFKHINDKEEPAFYYREIFITESDKLDFSFKRLLNGRLGHRIEFEKNNLLHKYTIDTYSFISSEIMSEKYECNGQYNYADSDAKKQALNTLKKKLNPLPKNRTAFGVLEHEDRGSTCDKDLNGKTPNEVFLDYTSYLAESLKNTFPNILFLHQAYFWSLSAPKNSKKLPSNLGVLFSPIEANFAKPLHSDSNKKIWQSLLSWKDKTDNVIVWDYFINFESYLTPYPNLYAKSFDLKEYKKTGFVKGVFLQGSFGGFGGDLSDLRIWVFSKLLWNPNQNINKLINEFCTYYYGKAGKYVQQYIKTLQIFISDTEEKLYAKTPINMNFLNKKNLKILSSILETGLSKVKKNSPYHEHLLKIILGIDILKALEENDTKAKKRVLEYLKNHPKTESFSEAINIDQIVSILKLDRKKPAPPKKAKGLKQGYQWLDFQEYQLELCCADIVKDKDASDGVSAVMDGSSGEWGFSMNFINIPKGKWDVYARVKITTSNNSVSDKARWALKYGIEPDINRGIKFVGQLSKGYNTVKLGTYDTKSDAKYLWISPPENNTVKKLFLDRIFFIKRD